MGVAVLTYGSENWATNRADRTIETMEITFLIGLYVSGYEAQMCNKNILQLLGIYIMNKRFENKRF